MYKVATLEIFLKVPPVSSTMSFFPRCHKLLCLLFLAIPALLQASEVWDAPAFSLSPAALQQAAASVKADKDAVATVLLHDEHYTYDREGRSVQTYRTIYRVENDEGVSSWDETSAQWEPWHQSKPEIRARVITMDG